MGQAAHGLHNPLWLQLSFVHINFLLSIFSSQSYVAQGISDEWLCNSLQCLIQREVYFSASSESVNFLTHACYVQFRSRHFRGSNSDMITHRHGVTKPALGLAWLPHATPWLRACIAFTREPCRSSCLEACLSVDAARHIEELCKRLHRLEFRAVFPVTLSDFSKLNHYKHLLRVVKRTKLKKPFPEDISRNSHVDGFVNFSSTNCTFDKLGATWPSL